MNHCLRGAIKRLCWESHRFSAQVCKSLAPNGTQVIIKVWFVLNVSGVRKPCSDPELLL